MPSITSQISYASTSAVLSDRSVYPNLFRTVPSDEPLILVLAALATVMQLLYYGWKILSILTEQQTHAVYSSMHACIPPSTLCTILHFMPEAFIPPDY